VVERQFQVVECQTQVAERRSGPFRLNLTTGFRDKSISGFSGHFLLSVIIGIAQGHSSSSLRSKVFGLLLKFTFVDISTFGVDSRITKVAQI